MPRDEDQPDLRRDHSDFLLTAGGPFYGVLVGLRLRTAAGLTPRWWFALIPWVAWAFGEGVQLLLGIPLDPMAYDLSLHVRLVITFPLLLASEPLLDQTVTSALRSLYRGAFCDPALLDRTVERAEQLRNSWVVELALLAISVIGGQLVLWRVFGSTGLVHGGDATRIWSFTLVWYAFVALPLFQFVMFRWLWRWSIWAYMLARISRMELSLLATHADFACGLAALARPMNGFSGFVLAIGALLSGAWAAQLLGGQTTIRELAPIAVVFLVAAMAIGAGPLLLFCGHLFRARRRTLSQYGDFMRMYVLRFHNKWITSPGSAEPLGTSDIQSLNDLGSAFQVIAKTRLFIFGPRNVLGIWSAGILPLLPLLATMLTVEAVLSRIVRIVLGGLPF